MMKSLLRFIELRGIPASGKTTQAFKWIEQFPNVIRLNRDDLRAMMFGPFYKRQNEPVIRAVEEAAARTAVKSGYNVIIDDTNLPPRSFWKDLANELGIKHVVHMFKVGVEEAIKRDAARTDKKSVGPAAIRTIARRMR